jgi:NMD protein affecting ribosome stability and mRNA decay
VDAAAITERWSVVVVVEECRLRRYDTNSTTKEVASSISVDVASIKKSSILELKGYDRHVLSMRVVEEDYVLKNPKTIPTFSMSASRHESGSLP